MYSALFIPVKCLILYLYSALLSTVQCIVVDRTASTLLWTVQLTQNSLYTALFVILLRVQCNSLYITLLSLRQYSLIPVSVIPSSVYCYPMCTELLSTVSCIGMSCTGKYTAPYCVQGMAVCCRVAYSALYSGKHFTLTPVQGTAIHCTINCAPLLCAMFSLYSALLFIPASLYFCILRKTHCYPTL